MRLSPVVFFSALFSIALPRICDGQEIDFTPTCVHTLVCAPPRRHGRVILMTGTLVSLDDPARMALLGSATLRYFTSERLGFGVLGLRRLADVVPSARAERPIYSAALEAALVLGVGRISYDMPFDWHVSAGPAIFGSDSGTRAGATFGSSVTLFYMPLYLLGVDWRFGTSGPAYAYLGLSLGFGVRAKYCGEAACRDFESEDPCPRRLRSSEVDRRGASRRGGP
jgi:hypothetical protein